MRSLFAVLALASAAASTAFPAAGQEGEPVCDAARVGRTACIANKLCLCREEPGGVMTRRTAGHRWDCGVLRPYCRYPEATRASPPAAWPPGLVVKVPALPR